MNYTVTHLNGTKEYHATLEDATLRQARTFYIKALRNIAMYGHGYSLLRLICNGKVLRSHGVEYGTIFGHKEVS